MDFGKRLKNARQNLRMTQKELSEKTGIKRTTIASYEVGNISPSFENVKLLADTLNVSTDYLSGVNIGEKFDRILDLKKIQSELKLAEDIQLLVYELSNFDFDKLTPEQLTLVEEHLTVLLKVLKMFKVEHKF